MSYRTLAERPGDAPAEPPAVVVVMLERTVWWHVALVLGGLAFVFAFSALVPYSSTAVSCQRGGADPAPECEIAQRSGLDVSRVRFTLAPGAFAARTDVDSDHDHETFLVVPAPRKVVHSVRQAWAESVVAEAEMFRVSTRPSWRADDGYAPLRYGLLALAALVLLAYPFQRMRTRIELDAAKEEMRVTRLAHLLQPDPTASSMKHVERVQLSEDHDGAPWIALVTDDKETRVASGRRDSCEAAVGEIARFLARLRKARTARVASSSNASELFSGWSELTDEEKWDRMEIFLARVSVEAEATVRRLPDDDDLELRGRQGGFPFHVRIDPTAPETFELELAVKQPMGDIDLTFSADAASDKRPEHARRTFVAEHVYIAARDEAASFRELPEELQAAIVKTIEDERLDYFRIGPEVIEVAGDSMLTDVGDPALHLERVLETTAAAARYLSALRSRKDES